MFIAAVILLLIIGIGLAAGGVWLIALGGSWYYVLAAAGFLAAGVLLYRRSASALLVYALVVAGSLAWAVYEAGFDWGQLAPRGWLIVILGILLLTPWVTRKLKPQKNRGWATAPGRLQRQWLLPFLWRDSRCCATP